MVHDGILRISKYHKMIFLFLNEKSGWVEIKGRMFESTNFLEQASRRETALEEETSAGKLLCLPTKHNGYIQPDRTLSLKICGSNFPNLIKF